MKDRIVGTVFIDPNVVKTFKDFEENLARELKQLGLCMIQEWRKRKDLPQ